MNTLGQRIRYARGTVTQDIFSAKISVSKGSLGGYERDENLPNTDVVLKICSETGISILWLLTGQGSPRLESPRLEAPLHQPPQPGESHDACCSSAPTSPPSAACPRCEKLETELDRERDERRELSAENRQWVAKTEQLLRENATLRERCATLEERQKYRSPNGDFSKQIGASSNNLLFNE